MKRTSTCESLRDFFFMSYLGLKCMKNRKEREAQNETVKADIHFRSFQKWLRHSWVKTVSIESDRS